MITDPNPGIHMRIVPMWEVLNSESVDSFAYESWDPETQTHHRPDMAEVLDHKIGDEGYPELFESIKKWGLKEGFEPTWDGHEVREGHHRIAALVELGAEWCPVIPNRKPWKAFTAPDGSTPGACAHCTDEYCERINSGEDWF